MHCDGVLRAWRLARLPVFRPPLPEIQAQEITFQTLEGVRYMHENEFAHRDLKPGVRSQIPGFKARRVQREHEHLEHPY